MMGIDSILFFTVKEEIDDNQLRNMAVALRRCFPRVCWTERGGAYGGPWHCLSKRETIQYDWEEFIPEEGETLIEFNTLSRYYGEGYERGPIMDIIGVAEFIEYFVHDARVYYAGDSSGISPVEFNAERRDELKRHYFEVNTHPYRAGWGQDEGDIDTPICSLCQVPYIRYGWGGGYAAFHCSGCGHNLKYRRDENDEWRKENEKKTNS